MLLIRRSGSRLSLDEETIDLRGVALNSGDNQPFARRHSSPLPVLLIRREVWFWFWTAAIAGRKKTILGSNGSVASDQYSLNEGYYGAKDGRISHEYGVQDAAAAMRRTCHRLGGEGATCCDSPQEGTRNRFPVD